MSGLPSACIALAAAALSSLKLDDPAKSRDGATGYPLQTELKVTEATLDDQLAQAQDALADSRRLYNSGEYEEAERVVRTLLPREAPVLASAVPVYAGKRAA